MPSLSLSLSLSVRGKHCNQHVSIVQQKFIWKKTQNTLTKQLIFVWKSTSIRLTYLVEGAGPCPFFQTAGV
jgi:hypothetical protein